MKPNVLPKRRIAMSPAISLPGLRFHEAIEYLKVFIFAFVLICIAGIASAQPVPGSITRMSVDRPRIVLAPTCEHPVYGQCPINGVVGLAGIADEHSTIFPPAYLPNRRTKDDYLFFLAAAGDGSGLVVLSDFGQGPDANNQWTLDYAPEFDHYQNPPRYGPIFAEPMAHGTCPTVEPAMFLPKDPTFDLNYADPGTVVKDPTNLANAGPGGLIMIYEGTNTCFGLPFGFYATMGVATSNDWGQTWPGYRYLLDDSGDPLYPLPSKNPCNRFPCVGPQAPTGALGGSACVGNVCTWSSTAQWPPDGSYGRYLVVGKYDSIQNATSKGYQAPSAFLDDVNGGPSPYLYATGGSLSIARAQLNGGTAPLSFHKWYAGSFSEPGIGGNDTPMSFLLPLPPPRGPFILIPAQYCADPEQERTMGSISYVEDLQVYLLTFVCISKIGNPLNPDGTTPGAAWFYSTNSDLSHQDQWSAPQQIVGSWSAFKSNSADCQDYQGWYP